ncbi:MAG: hypothetical protein R2727_07100 [Bacteroidales bacterium]
MTEIVAPPSDFEGSVALFNRSQFSHESEIASPGYYRVILENGVEVELSATDRCGIQKYTAKDDGYINILIDLGFAINWDRPVQCELAYSGGIVSGLRRSTGWAKDQYQYFYSSFSKELVEVMVFSDSTFVRGDEVSGPASQAVKNQRKTK